MYVISDEYLCKYQFLVAAVVSTRPFTYSSYTICIPSNQFINRKWMFYYMLIMSYCPLSTEANTMQKSIPYNHHWIFSLFSFALSISFLSMLKAFPFTAPRQNKNEEAKWEEKKGRTHSIRHKPKENWFAYNLYILNVYVWLYWIQCVVCNACSSSSSSSSSVVSLSIVLKTNSLLFIWMEIWIRSSSNFMKTELKANVQAIAHIQSEMTWRTPFNFR